MVDISAFEDKNVTVVLTYNRNDKKWFVKMENEAGFLHYFTKRTFGMKFQAEKHAVKQAEKRNLTIVSWETSEY